MKENVGQGPIEVVEDTAQEQDVPVQLLRFVPVDLRFQEVQALNEAPDSARALANVGKRAGQGLGVDE